MGQSKSLRKRVAITLFFILFSCQPCEKWVLDKTLTRTQSFNSVRLTYYPNESYCDLELELVSTCSGLRLYINVFSLPIVPDCPEENKVPVSIQIDDEEYLFLADLLQGGQRLLLPEEGRCTIINALLEMRSVEISTGRYCSVITAQNFYKLYQELM